MAAFLEVLGHLWLSLLLVLLSKVHVVHLESLLWVLLLHTLLLNLLLGLSFVLPRLRLRLLLLLLLLLVVEFELEVGRSRLLHGVLLLLLGIHVVLHHLEVEVVLLLLIFALGLLVWLGLLGLLELLHHHLGLSLVVFVQLLHGLSRCSAELRRIFLVGSNLVKRLGLGLGTLVSASRGLLGKLVVELLVVNLVEVSHLLTHHLLRNLWHLLLLLVMHVVDLELLLLVMLDLLLALVLVLLRNVQHWLVHLPLSSWLLTLLLSSEFLLDLLQADCLVLLLGHLLLESGLLRKLLLLWLLWLDVLLDAGLSSWSGLLAHLRLHRLLRDVWLDDTLDFVEFGLDLLMLGEKLPVVGLLWSVVDRIVVLSWDVGSDVLAAAVVSVDLETVWKDEFGVNHVQLGQVFLVLVVQLVDGLDPHQRVWLSLLDFLSFLVSDEGFVWLLACLVEDS
jgi:hypothetical protein